MRTDVTELPDSRVRIEATVEPEVLNARIDGAAKRLAREIKLPGFRKGKVPPQLVIQRIGREAVLEEALRDGLPEWVEQALLATGAVTVGDPKIDVPELPEDGGELRLAIEVGVRPTAKLGEYRGLEVGRAEPEVPDGAVEQELGRLQEAFGSLNPVERSAASGDVVVIDYEGTIEGEPFEGSSGKDLTIELGSEGLLPEFDRALSGRSAGDELAIEVSFPDDHEPAELAGKTAVFATKLREVREKQLPPLDDEFARSASEFDTIDELGEELRTRLAAVQEARADADFRDAAVDAAAADATVELPKELVHARAHELWERFERALAARGIDPQAYARMQGKDRHDLINEGEESAARSLRREATLAAVADAERIEVADEDLVEALGAGEGNDAPDKILARLKETGRDALLREEVRMRKAAELIAEHAKPIPQAQAAAREALWTPEKEPAEREPQEQPTGGSEPGKLWTPGS